MNYPVTHDEVLPIDLQDAPTEDLTEWLHDMLLIREFEEALDKLALSGQIPGGVHTAVGQEAVAVGAIRALAGTDLVMSSHRPHHHALAKGVTPQAMMAELFGREGGTGGGRCGTMHIFSREKGYLGGNGIVGASVGLAMGAALAAQQLKREQVAVGFCGDGAVNTGRTWESINMAALWHLPLIVVCENNQYAVETRIDRSMAGDSITQRASGFGLPAIQVDGQDAVAVYQAVRQARRRALAGEGPTFIEAVTYRYHGHSTGQVITYRTEDELNYWRGTRDPIQRFSEALESTGRLTPGGYEEIAGRVALTVADSIAFASAQPWPKPSTAASGVTGLTFELQGNPR